MQRLVLLGLNHTTAPLEVREKVAFNQERTRDALGVMRQQFAEAEVVVLSTCNRVELYVARAVHGHPRSEELSQFLADFHGVGVDDLRAHLYEKTERQVVEHLFNVTASLDSMVLGETQILGQVRQAYELASQHQATGAVLNPLFQRAIAVGKQVMHETSLNEGRLSIASVAVDYAKRIFDHFSDKSVLCIGGGKMARLVLQHFSNLKPGQLKVCNRDLSKAESLAAVFSAQALPFELLADHLVTADIVITSTGATQPIITRKQFEKILKLRRYKPIFVIDIAVPRDVEAAVGNLQNVYLYNLDDLQKVVAGTQSQRSDAVAGAQQIITRHVEDFLAWNRSRQLGPVIDQLYQRYHAMAQEELNRTLNRLPNLSPAEREHLEDLSRRIVNKLLHEPITTLRQTDGAHGPTTPYLHALAKLFHLPDPPEET